MSIINNDPSNNSFLNEKKIATVRAIYKKKSCDKIENYKLVSILSCTNTYLSKFIAAYRKNYSSGHVLVRLFENWREALDEKFVVGTVLIDLSRSCDCIFNMTY